MLAWYLKQSLVREGGKWAGQFESIQMALEWCFRSC